MDFGKASVAFAGATGVAIFTALKTGGYTPSLLVASLLLIINLAAGVHVSTAERRYRTVAIVNFCACFVPLTIAMAHGGEFKPEIVKSIYQAMPA